MTTANLTKVIVPCRLSYAHLWEPDSINGSEPKYSVSCIIDKNDKETIAKIKKAIEVAKDEGKGKWGGKIPANLKTPLRDGDIDRPEDEAYADSMAYHADNSIPASIDDWLDQFDMFSIYEVLPQILELWGDNLATEVAAKKDLAEVNGK